MRGTRASIPYTGRSSPLDAAATPVSDIRGTSGTQGPNPVHYLSRYGGAVMDDLIPTPNPTEFGSFESYIAARVDGFRATRGTSRLEIIDLFAKTDEDGDCGEESMAIDKTGHFVNLSTGSLRELQMEFWGARTWEEMCEMAVFTANEADAAAHGLKFKPLSASARAIVEKLLPGDGPQQGGGPATNLGGDLEEGAQPEAGAAE